MNLKERIAKASKDAKLARNIKKEAKHWKYVNMYNMVRVRYEGLRVIR